MLGLRQASALTSLSTTQTRALRASSSMPQRVPLDSRLVPRVRAMSRSRPRMALSEFEGRPLGLNCATLASRLVAYLLLVAQSPRRPKTAGLFLLEPDPTENRWHSPGPLPRIRADGRLP